VNVDMSEIEFRTFISGRLRQVADYAERGHWRTYELDIDVLLDQVHRALSLCEQYKGIKE
jgi:hypothetical protein